MAREGRGSLVERPTPPAELTCEVHTVTFFSESTSYLVAKVQAKGEPGVVTIVGTMGLVSPGETLYLRGQWTTHSQYGRQFAVEYFEQRMPASLTGIKRYLESKQIKGVGPVLAGKMLAEFGDRVLDVLDEAPEKLLAVKGITPKVLEKITASWNEQREVRGLMLFLQTHDVPTTFAQRIFKHYGSGAVQKLKDNPYGLAYDIHGIGFKTADAMALKLGFAPDCPQRLEAAIIYGLFTLGDAGHLFYPRDELLERVDAMLGGVGLHLLAEALENLDLQKKVRIERLPQQDIEHAVYLTHFYNWEREIAERLWAISSHPAPMPADKVAKIMPSVEAECGITLSSEQHLAVTQACTNKTFIITGGPGTGKTTITKAIVRALDKLGYKVRLCAPTGRAAKRMTEATGFPASTLHRLLGSNPGGGFAHNEEHKLKADVVLVDEASMLDVQLLLSLLRALPLTCRLVLVGDVNQLPSVGPGNVLGDMLDSGSIEQARLTHIYRQALESMIVVNAHRVNEGQFPVQSVKKPPQADFFWVECDDPQQVQEKIVDLVAERIPRTYGFDPRRDIQVLSPMHKGEVGTQALNELLQARLNPSGRELVRGKNRFRQGDRVLQTKNNYEKDVFNGDLGWIVDVNPHAVELSVDFDGRIVPYESADLDELALAYAVSVHKSQGSEYPVVVVPIVTQHFVMLKRNLIYTALTRARKLAVILGGKKALGIGLGAVGATKRFTHLRYRLQETFNR
ncbi:ATP-dependent RecD-like DNA helicase [Fundidesulfovibrio agrisoli]|uniref:SF1B family DNA helicase RecD2 n=1 Tax=Fundidesulfovibrio agrisoli TaxID=2922717 RepID=UPI001FAD0E51|nr:ATP-dependent RecD-like DNA helicase [Fundidesulfovibrio agrisoli]